MKQDKQYTHHGQGRTIGGLADRLGYYLAHGGPGTDASNFGEMCERLSRAGHVSVRCGDCHGIGCARCDDVGFVGTRSRATKIQCARCDGTGLGRDGHECLACTGKGHRWRAAPDNVFTTVRCNRCKGSGEVPNEELEDVCPSCGGEMCHVPVTVRETGSSKKGKAPKREASADGDHHEAQASADEEAVRAYGEMSRLVLRIRAQDPVIAAALEAFYGADGDRWAPTRWGRLHALWQFTEAGMSLIEWGRERSAQGHGFEIKPLDQLASERNAEECSTTPNIRRRSLIGEADKAARVLLTRANDLLATVGQQ